jgi:hypothetical protein
VTTSHRIAAWLNAATIATALAGPTLLASPGALADELPPKHRIEYGNLLVLRYNPLGAEDRFDLGYRRRLYAHDEAALRDNHAGLAFTPTISPAVIRVGGTAEARLLSVLVLGMGYYFVAWLGTFDQVQSFPSATAAHSDTALDAGGEDGNAYVTTGSQLQLRAQPIVKLGPVVVRNDLNLFYTDAALHDGDRAFYDIRSDLLVPNRGWSLTNDSDVLFLSDFGLVAGIRSSVAHALFEERHFLPGEPHDTPATPTWRLGPLLAYVFSDDLGRRFNKPTVLLIASWWLKHRYRTGRDVSQGVPNLVLGFKFEGELWRQQ